MAANLVWDGQHAFKAAQLKEVHLPSSPTTMIHSKEAGLLRIFYVEAAGSALLLALPWCALSAGGGGVNRTPPARLGARSRQGGGA